MTSNQEMTSLVNTVLHSCGAEKTHDMYASSNQGQRKMILKVQIVAVISNNNTGTWQEPDVYIVTETT